MKSSEVSEEEILGDFEAYRKNRHDANALLSIVIGGKAARRIVAHPKAPAVRVTVSLTKK